MEKHSFDIIEKKVTCIDWFYILLKLIFFILRYSVQSRYKTSTLKHRPQPVKPIETNKPKNKLLGRHSSGSIKSYHSRQCNIDDVPTMIQMENDLNTKETSDIRNDILKPLTRSIFEQFCDENKVIFGYQKHFIKYQFGFINWNSFIKLKIIIY